MIRSYLDLLHEALHLVDVGLVLLNQLWFDNKLASHKVIMMWEYVIVISQHAKIM